MYNIPLNNNIIPHTWKLANIIPIPKPNKDMNIGTSYIPISLLSVEKTLLSYVITNNIQHISTQHGFKSNPFYNHNPTQHKQHHRNRVQPKQTTRKHTSTVALDMSKAFETVNIHTLTHKLHQKNLPHTLIKFIANYIKGRKAYTTFRNKTSTQRQFKNDVPQCGVLSPTLFNYTHLTPQAPVKLVTYADDITITSTHNDIIIAKANTQSYLHEIHAWTQTNNIILNHDKTTCTLFTPDTTEYSTQLELQIDNIPLPMNINPKIIGLTLHPKLTYKKNIEITTTKARNTIHILKALTSTTWRKQKETILATYKAITRPILEYISTIWLPLASDTNIR